MAIVTTNDKYYKEIANIIRRKSDLNTTDTYTPDRMADKIFYNIGGGNLILK